MAAASLRDRHVLALLLQEKQLLVLDLVVLYLVVETYHLASALDKWLGVQRVVLQKLYVGVTVALWLAYVEAQEGPQLLN